MAYRLRCGSTPLLLVVPMTKPLAETGMPEPGFQHPGALYDYSIFQIPREVGNRLLFLLYIDPTAGSMLLQVLLGGVVGIAVIVRLFWHHIKSTLSGRGRSSDSDER